MLGEFIILRHLDTTQDVCDTRDTQEAELFGELALHTHGYQIIDTLRCVEQSEQSLAVLVVDVNDHVGVLDVMDPRDMLVADALDAVTAEAVVQDRGALQGFADAELEVRVLLLEVVARAHRACRTGGKARACKAILLTLDRLKRVR